MIHKILRKPKRATRTPTPGYWWLRCWVAGVSANSSGSLCGVFSSPGKLAAGIAYVNTLLLRDAHNTMYSFSVTYSAELGKSVSPDFVDKPIAF